MADFGKKLAGIRGNWARRAVAWDRGLMQPVWNTDSPDVSPDRHGLAGGNLWAGAHKPVNAAGMARHHDAPGIDVELS